jgi:hypothetical protein
MSIPVILGLEETIGGTIQEYYGERGYVSVAIEGGQHHDPATPDHLESALWIALVSEGFVDERHVPDVAKHRARLRSITRGLPSVVEVVHRHGRREQDAFKMIDGFRNFSPVRRGQPVARDRDGEIHAAFDGMIILPNYQMVGNDGFFLGRRVRRFWLRLSTLVRRLRLDHLLPLLPGVRSHPADGMVLLVNPEITRWKVLKIFHLLGFRMCGREGGRLVFRRRRESIRL